MARIEINLREKGYSLVEVLVSVAIISVLIPSFVLGLSTAAKALALTDERQTAKNLAESQMEYILDQPYAVSYSPPISAEYSGYNVNVTAESIPLRDADIQRIRLIVSHDGRPIILTGNCTLEDYKVKK